MDVLGILLIVDLLEKIHQIVKLLTMVGRAILRFLFSPKKCRHSVTMNLLPQPKIRGSVSLSTSLGAGDFSFYRILAVKFPSPM